jgi:hypothetical protein
MLSYQGKLTDTLGVPVADTTYSVNFRLYSVASGGSPFWNETQTVRTRTGLFSTLLGAVTPIGSVPDAGVTYLGIAVAGGAELTPRLRIASAAYAYLTARAANADLLQGKDTAALDSRYVNEGQANSVTGAMLVDGTVLTADVGDTAVTMAKIAQAGATTGQVVKWTGSAWAPGPDNTGGGSGVTNVYQDTGITCVPNPITSTGNVKLNLSYTDGRYVNEAQAAGGDLTGTYPNPVLAATGVSTGTYGSATQVGQVTVDAKGRLTAASNVTISGVPPGGTAGGDLSGTYPNPGVDGLQGRAVATTAPSSGQALKWNGSSWTPMNDSAGGPPSGPAGGDLTGTYPNPTITTNAVGSAEVIDASLRGADLVKPCSLSGSGGGTAALLHVLPANDGGIAVRRTSTGTTNAAVLAQTTSGSGCGVIGEATGSDGASVGIYGHTTPGTRPGVFGYNAAGTVLAPNVAAGVAGYSSTGPSFYVDNAGTYGLHVRKSGSYGVRVDSATGVGLYIKAATGYGIHMFSCGGNGVCAESTPSGYSGFYARYPGQDGYRVWATPNDGFSVGDSATRHGLYVARARNSGAYVADAGAYGVYANSNSVRGGYFRNNNNSYYALTAWNNTGTGGTVKGLYIQGHGYATGGWQTYLAAGGRGYGLVSPDMEIMASGTGRLSGGRASVNLDRTFRDAVTGDVPLKVIVTPNSMCNGVCVTNRSADGFTVAELADGSSNAGFDWIAIGRLKGYQQQPETQPILTDEPPQREGPRPDDNPTYDE